MPPAIPTTETDEGGNGAFFGDLSTYSWGVREPDAIAYGTAGRSKRVTMLGGYRYQEIPYGGRPLEADNKNSSCWVSGCAGGYRYGYLEDVPPNCWVSGWEEAQKVSTSPGISLRWPRNFPVPFPGADPDDYWGCFYTQAPLQNVVAAQMYYHRHSHRRKSIMDCFDDCAADNGEEEKEEEEQDSEEDSLKPYYWSGIILHYQNGGSRVVGEVRMIDGGVRSPSTPAGKTIVMPKLLCLEEASEEGGHYSIGQRMHFLTEANIENGGHLVDVKPSSSSSSSFLGHCPRFNPMPEDSTGARIHKCYYLAGTIDWWFTGLGEFRVRIRAPGEE